MRLRPRQKTFVERSVAALASRWNALCCLPATQPWLWLVRSGPVESAPALGPVLLDTLPVLLDALGAGACSHD